MWNEKQIEQHREAARLLGKIKDLTFDYIRNKQNVSEYEIQQFIIENFKKFNLKSDKYPPIVAFRENSAIVHYYANPDSKLLSKNSLILIDLWAKLEEKGAPFADISWVAYYGEKIPEKVKKVFSILLEARDSCLAFLENSLEKGEIPLGKEVDKISRDIIGKSGFEGRFLHGIGHCIGFTSPHGTGSNINMKGKQQLKLNLGYTIEPGIYLESEFGVRSEMDFYINDKFELIVTTPFQKEIVRI